MSWQVRLDQQTPYKPEQWDQYDTHPGHPEPETVRDTTASKKVMQGCGSTAVISACTPHGDGPQLFKRVVQK